MIYRAGGKNLTRRREGRKEIGDDGAMIVWLSYFWIKSERLGGRGVGEPRPHPETKYESRSTDPSFAISGFPLRGNDETERENLEDLGRADISRRRTEPIASATLWIPAFAGMTGVENGNDCRKSRPYSNFFAPLRLCVKLNRCKERTPL